MISSPMIDEKSILNSVYNGMVAVDTRGMITFFNKTAERIFKIPAHEALGRYILDILPNTGGKLLECLKEEKPLYGEKLKGKEVVLISNINPVVEHGKITGAVSVFQDISEFERVSEELDTFKNMKIWLDTIIDSSYDGLFICDHEGKVMRINKAAGRIGGFDPDQIIGQNVQEMVSSGLIDKSVTLEVLKTKTSVTILQQVKGDKKVLVTGNPIFDEKGDVLFILTNIRDISELDQLRSRLQEVEALAGKYSSKLSEIEMKEVDLFNVIFRSEEMERVIKMALRIAKVDTTSLILGESGVGKGMVAKLIHKVSDRRAGPFIRVDCGGIPGSLVESELFGYEKGAFTGARVEGKPGFFELAEKGTLFLDEIGEIPFGSQSKLLRFLETREIVRVGGTLPREIDVRIIAATNRNIEKMVASREFREDLYYRLNVVPIHVPPLRDRRDDILALIFHFLEKFNTIYKKKKTFSSEAVEALCRYDFPGNIRELANFVERLVVLLERDRIELSDMPNPFPDYLSQTMLSRPSIDTISSSFHETINRYERSIIEQAIKKYGSQRLAAKALGLDQATVSRKMRKCSSLKNDVILHK